jgi:hypothetical protein
MLDAGCWMLDAGKAGFAETAIAAGILDARFSILVRPTLLRRRLLQGYWMLESRYW